VVGRRRCEAGCRAADRRHDHDLSDSDSDSDDARKLGRPRDIDDPQHAARRDHPDIATADDAHDGTPRLDHDSATDHDDHPSADHHDHHHPRWRWRRLLTNTVATALPEHRAGTTTRASSARRAATVPPAHCR
jgi:hypothetical protein